MKEKMKKLLKLFAVCTMAFVSCFTLFACKETPPTDPETEQTPSGGSETPSGSESNPSEGGQTSSDGTTVIDYTVTEDEWASAIATNKFGNVAINQEVTAGESFTQVLEFDGTTVREVSGDDEYYFTKDGDKNYAYQKDGSNWKKTELGESKYNMYTSQIYGFANFAYDESYTYNSETHAYEAENVTAGGMPYIKVALYFENKVLVKLYYEMNQSDGDTTFTIVSTMTLTYGSVVITLPTITE